jgi:hypothetical protein
MFMSKAERVQCNVTNVLTVYMSTNNEVRVDGISKMCSLRASPR